MTDSPDAPEPDDAETSTTEDDQGAALERAAESIQQAQDAQGTVAAHEDITTLDAERAGEAGEDPDAGQP